MADHVKETYVSCAKIGNEWLLGKLTVLEIYFSHIHTTYSKCTY